MSVYENLKKIVTLTATEARFDPRYERIWALAVEALKAWEPRVNVERENVFGEFLNLRVAISELMLRDTDDPKRIIRHVAEKAEYDLWQGAKELYGLTEYEAMPLRSMAVDSHDDVKPEFKVTKMIGVMPHYCEGGAGCSMPGYEHIKRDT